MNKVVGVHPLKLAQSWSIVPERGDGDGWWSRVKLHSKFWFTLKIQWDGSVHKMRNVQLKWTVRHSIKSNDHWRDPLVMMESLEMDMRWDASGWDGTTSLRLWKRLFEPTSRVTSVLLGYRARRPICWGFLSRAILYWACYRSPEVVPTPGSPFWAYWRPILYTGVLGFQTLVYVAIIIQVEASFICSLFKFLLNIMLKYVSPLFEKYNYDSRF